MDTAGRDQGCTDTEQGTSMPYHPAGSAVAGTTPGDESPRTSPGASGVCGAIIDPGESFEHWCGHLPAGHAGDHRCTDCGDVWNRGPWDEEEQPHLFFHGICPLCHAIREVTAADHVSVALVPGQPRSPSSQPGPQLRAAHPVRAPNPCALVGAILGAHLQGSASLTPCA